MSAQAASNSKGAPCQAPSRTDDLRTATKALGHAAKNTAVATARAAVRATKTLTSAMKQELAGSQKGQVYGKRSQVETVNSMIKRNLGDSLRARSEGARGLEHRAIAYAITSPGNDF